MKTTSKLLAMLLIVVMSMSLFGGLSAFAETKEVDVYVRQTSEPAVDGTATYSVTCSESVDVSSCTLTYNGSETWAAGFSFDGSTISIDGTDWSTADSMAVEFVNGGTANVAWGMGNTGNTTVNIYEDPTVEPSVTPVSSTGSSTSFTVTPLVSLEGVIGHNSNGDTSVAYSIQDGMVVVPAARSYTFIKFEFDSDACSPDTVTIYNDELPAPPDSEFKVTSNNGKSYYTFEKASDSYTYTYTNPDDYIITDIEANGLSISGWSAKNGTITIRGAEFADSTSATDYYLAFYAENRNSGITYDSKLGYYIQKSANMNVDEITVNGLNVNGYVQNSHTPVWFKTNYNLINNPDALKLYNTKTGKNVALPAGAFTIDTSYNDLYTVTFDNDFLDGLDVAKYSVRVYYNTTNNTQYKTPGVLNVGTSATTTGMEKFLKFTNSNVSDTEYDWYSGSIKPEMFSPLFLVDGGYLQVSKDGKSWSNVGINDYMIKLDNGKRTAYAYFGDSYLNKLEGNTNYYYRAYVPAGKLDVSEVHSNPIIIRTGATLSYIDTDKHVINSTKNLRFKSSAPIDKVYVGSIELTDPNYFSLSKDKKTVTLSPEFLNSRTAGNTYTLSVLTKDGEKLSTTFQILTPGQAASSPKTGDESQIALWAAFVFVSGAAIAVVAPKLRKNED